MTSTILIAGATGDLGARIVREVLAHEGTRVRVLTRPGSSTAQEMFSSTPRAQIVTASYRDSAALTRAVTGSDVVVSAVSGDRSVIVDAQRCLLQATVSAGVPRFIPSDFSSDYRRIPPNSNRNFELRREFAGDLDAAPVRATSVFIGGFADMLTGQAPIILFDRRRVLYWSSQDQELEFTTKDDVARFTAAVALDEHAPRAVEIAGDVVTARSLAATMSDLTGTRFKTMWAGSAGSILAASKLVKRFTPECGEAFPAWQGMQYLSSFFSGRAALRHIDNDRYGPRTWTTTADVLRDYLAAREGTAASRFDRRNARWTGTGKS